MTALEAIAKVNAMQEELGAIEVVAEKHHNNPIHDAPGLLVAISEAMNSLESVMYALYAAVPRG